MIALEMIDACFFPLDVPLQVNLIKFILSLRKKEEEEEALYVFVVESQGGINKTLIIQVKWNFKLNPKHKWTQPTRWTQIYPHRFWTFCWLHNLQITETYSCAPIISSLNVHIWFIERPYPLNRCAIIKPAQSRYKAKLSEYSFLRTCLKNGFLRTPCFSNCWLVDCVS